MVKATLILALLAGCRIENKGGSISLLEPPAPIVIPAAPQELGEEEPILRILDISGGRMRLLVRDPLTGHYKVVG